MQRANRGWSLVISSAICIGFAGSAARADLPMPGLQAGDLHITTDSTDYNINTGAFSMPHHVSASRPGTQIDGDRAHGNGRTKIVTIDGNVTVHQNGGSPAGVPLGSGSASQEPSTLSANSLTLEVTTKTYTATGNVRYVQGMRLVTADKGVLSDATHDLHLTGNVHVQDGGQVLEAEAVDYNTLSQSVHATSNVRITVPLATPLPGAQPGPAASGAAPQRSDRHGRSHHG